MHINVKTFPNVQPTKEQALKPLEESAEVFAAWQEFSKEKTSRRFLLKQKLLQECADVITATCNLIDSLGYGDEIDTYIAEVEEKNRRRGRYDE